MSHQYQWLNLATHILEEFPIFLLIGNVWKSCLTGIDWYAGQSFVHNWGPATSAAFQGGRCPARISHLKWSPPRPLDVHKLGLAPSTFTTRTRTLCPGWQKGVVEQRWGMVNWRDHCPRILGGRGKKEKVTTLSWTGFWTVRNWKGKVIRVSLGSFIEIPQGDLAHQRKYKVFLPCQSRGLVVKKVLPSFCLGASRPLAFCWHWWRCPVMSPKADGISSDGSMQSTVYIYEYEYDYV